MNNEDVQVDDSCIDDEEVKDSGMEEEIALEEIGSPDLVADTTSPTVRSISLSSTTITVPEKVEMTAEITDEGSGVSSAQIGFSTGAASKTVFAQLSMEGYADGKWHGVLDFDEYANGIYKIVSISVRDKARNETLYLSDWIPDKFKNISIIVNNPDNADNTPPQVISLSIDKTTVEAPGKIEITADIIDDESGVYVNEGVVGPMVSIVCGTKE